MFRFDNEYLSLIREAITAAAAAKGATLDIVDGQNSQPTQNEQIDLFISKNLPAIAVNQVDRELANVTLEKAKAADIPVVFFNKEPLPEVLQTLGQGLLRRRQGRGVRHHAGPARHRLLERPSRGRQERRRDPPVRDALGSRRPPGRADPDESSPSRPSTTPVSRPRSSQREIGDWNRAMAIEQMGAIYAQHGDAIEFVLANNDNMAIGAVEALKANGYFGDTGKFMPVVGVDATEPALESMRAGELLGTVLNDAVNQAHGDVQPGLRARRGRHADRREHGLRHRRPVRLGALRPGRTRRPLGSGHPAARDATASRAAR